MDDFLRMLIINPGHEITPKSSGTKRNVMKQKIEFSGAKSAIGGKMASPAKCLMHNQNNFHLVKVDMLGSPTK